MLTCTCRSIFASTSIWLGLLLLASCTSGTVDTGGPTPPADTDHDGYTTQVDCDDSDAAVHPGMAEVCGDSVDQDCSGVDEVCAACGDAVVLASGCTCGGVRHTDGICCTDAWHADGYCCTGTWQAGACATCNDGDSDGYDDALCGGDDCNDAASTVHPGATETCGDGIDQDCSGLDLACAADTTAPVLSSGLPMGTLAGGTTQTTLRVTTNEAATCKWSDSAGTTYAAMTSTFTTTGTTSHSTPVTGLADSTSYTYYVRCQDGAGNATSADYVVTFSVGSGTGPLTISLVPSRTSGVAPLSVFFDASETTDTLVTSRPFHDLEYRWDFGDPLGSPVSGTTWATGSGAGVNSRNTATGPVAAHVFEVLGTYTVSLSVFDGTNTAIAETTITVSDPEVVFAGMSTVCVAAATLPVAGVAGCPVGATAAQQVSFPAAISSYATTGARVLFKRGDTFTAASEARLTTTGPGIIGAYGTGALPLIQMTGNTNVLGFSSSSTPDFKDWRIMDLDMDGMNGDATSGTGISSTGGGLSQVTVLRLTYRNMNNAIGFALDLINYLNNYFIENSRPAEAIHAVDQVAVVDSTVLPGAATVYSAYDSGNRIAFMGNNFDNGGNSSGSHITRWPFLNKAVISNNTFSRPGFTRLAIKLHAPYWNETFGVFDVAATQPVIALNYSNYSAYANGDGYSKYVVISDNKLTDAANPWSVELGPQDSGSDERIRHVIVERNWWVANTASQVALRVSASEITARNNIFNFSNGSNSQTAIQVVKDGVVITSDQVRIYNNTIYTSYAVPSGQFAGVELAAPVTNITARNNLAYAPNAEGPVMFVNSCGACLTASNNSSDAQVQGTSPNFSSTAFVNPADFSIGGGSYAISAGIAVPVWSDFFLVPQTSARDLGAVRH
ncbi:MAG: MopE-related protein [Myxococcota bacterium]